MASHQHLSVLLTLLVALSARARAGVLFRDVSVQAGLDYSIGAQKTYGGPSIADLDQDGFPDLLLTHHDSHFIEVYFNNGNGSFSKVPLSSFRLWEDVHALNAFRYGPNSEHMHFTVSRGGAYGRRPAHNRVFRVDRARNIREVTKAARTARHSGRGRSALFMNLRGPGAVRPGAVDMLSLNAAPLNRRRVTQVAFRNVKAEPLFRFEPARGYGRNLNWYAAPIDFDNDGRIDVVSFEKLTIHSVTGRFSLTDVTNAVLPDDVRPVGVVSVVELDFDNDGRWDLYVATTRTGDLRWRRPVRQYRDYLLRNVGGRYEDVTEGAGISQDGQTRGVTAGDVDNDGRVDLIVSKYYGRAVVLRNMGNGKFSALRQAMPARLRKWVPGDGLSLFDYDLDGRLDVLVSEGDGVKLSQGGFYRLHRNLSPYGGNHYLLVRVGSSPRGGATSQHAIVRVRVGETWMQRRVGPAGVSVSISMIETVHFGLGSAATADRVVVLWVDGAERRLSGVRGDRVLTVGTVGAA